MIVRIVLALLSVAGLVVSIVVYIESVAGAAFDTALLWTIVLAIGTFAVDIPIFIVERRRSRDRSFFWAGLGQRIPPWAVTWVKLLWLAVLAHFVWLFIKDHGAVPAIEDGQWVLASHGHVVKVLTEREYLIAKSAELKTFAMLMIANYMMPTLYWWFTIKHQAMRQAQATDIRSG